MPSSPRDITQLLQSAGARQPGAEDALYALLWDELRRIARAHMERQPPGHTLQPTALVNEAWLRLAPDTGASWEDREHFLSFASRVMRSVLVDHARRGSAAKRGGESGRVPLEGLDVTLTSDDDRRIDILALDEALERLQAEDPELARVVDLRFFGGLTMEETARLIEVSLSTTERHWRLARMWLRERMGEGRAP